MKTSPPQEPTTPITITFYPDDEDDYIFTCHVRALRGADWSRLLRAHPSSVRGDDYDAETFCPAVLAESIVAWTTTQGGAFIEDEARHPTEPEMVELWADLPQWARRELFNPVQLLNVAGGALGKARSRQNVNGDSATDATN